MRESGGGESSSWAATALLGAAALLFSFPLLWMLAAAFKTNLEIFTPLPLLPEHFEPQAFALLLSGEVIPFPRQLANSLFVGVLQTAAATALSVCAGFAFAKYRFPLRRALFGLALAVILVPQQVLVLPLFSWLARLGLYDSLFAVILPGAVSGIGVLFFSLVYRRVPDAVLDLARSEGASEWRVLLVTLPLIRSALLGFVLIHFILCWHQHLLPLVMLSAEEHKTVTLGLAGLYGVGMRVPYALLMAGSALTVLPTALLYGVLERHLRSSVSQLSTSR